MGRLMNMEQLLEWELAGGTKVSRENLFHWHFIHHESYMTQAGIEPRLPQWEASG